MAEPHSSPEAPPGPRPGAGDASAGRWSVLLPQMLILLGAGFLGAKLSRPLWVADHGFPSFWALDGLYLAALLLSRQARWPLVIGSLAAGTLAYDLSHGTPLAVALAYFGTYTLSALTGAVLVRSLGGKVFRLETLGSVWIFIGATVFTCAAVGGPLSALLASLYWKVPWLTAYGQCFTASLAVILLSTPMILACANPRIPAPSAWRLSRIVESVLLFGTLGLASASMFSGASVLIALPSLLLMWAIWAVIRFSAVGGGLAMLIVGVISIVGTVRGLGPFARPGLIPSESILRLMIYLAVWSGFFQIVAAILAERSRAVRDLAALNRELESRVADRTDSLTRAGEELRISENRLALAVKAGHSGTFDWDIAANKDVWSDDLLALYGMTSAEFGGKFESWLDALHPEDVEAAQAAIRDAMQSGHFATQFRIRRRDDGKIRWMEGRGTVFYDLQGKPIRLLGINVDITEQKEVESALQESEQRLRFVLEAVNVGIWSVEVESGVLTVSPECRRIFGVGPGERFDRYEHVRARIHPDDREEERAAAAAARIGRGEYNTEYRVRWDDGDFHWILARGQVAAPAVGNALTLSGIVLDITSRKQVEEALKESESKLRSYYEASPIYMGLVELEGNDLLHLYDNPASCRFFGVPVGGTTGRRATEFGMDPALLERWLKSYRLSAERQEPVRFEMSIPTPAGVRWLSATITPLPKAAEGRPRFSYVAEDVTSRRRTENSLRQHASRQATLLELTRTILARRADAPALAAAIFQRVAGVLETDIGFNYRYAPGAAALELVFAYGFTPDQTEEFRFISPDESFCGAVALSGVPLIADASRILSDPRGEFVRGLGVRAYACHPLLATDGRVLGTLSFCSTRRERFEPEEVSFLQTLCHYVAIAWERSAAEAAMLQAKETAEAASRAKDEFLAALSHELRTPLNPVLLLASELLHEKNLPGPVHEDLATIRRNVELEARLIDDLLDLTRITRGKVHLERRAVAAHRVLREALEILQADLADQRLQLDLELAEGEPMVMADPVRLQQVFWNVLRNAIKFTPAGGNVTVRSFFLPDSRLAVEVADTGEGIAPEHLTSIFETFNQGEGGHRFGGLGLGLAIARSIIELHGGRISAASSGPGGGATFRMEIPLCHPTTSPVTHHGAGANGEAAPKPPTGLRILLVEDHEPTRNALGRLLTRRGHRISAAENLAAARSLAEEGEFDLLISDLGLPDGDGSELMREFRLRGGPDGLALSGYGMDSDLQRSLSAGFFAHLVKPVDVDLLDRTMAEWARKAELAKV